MASAAFSIRVASRLSASARMGHALSRTFSNYLNARNFLVLLDNQRLVCGRLLSGRIPITNDLPNVFCLVSRMANSFISCFIQRIEERVVCWHPLMDCVPPTLQASSPLPVKQLWTILSGMLGIAGLRSFDKLKGADTEQVGAPKVQTK